MLRLSVLIASLVGVLSFVVLADYIRIEPFLHYRLALNVHLGHGLVYNSGDSTLVTLSPLYSLLHALAPQNATTVSKLLSIVSFAIAGGLLYRLLKTTHINANLVLLLWLLTWPVWNAILSPAPLAFALVVLALGERDRWRMAGFIAGLAPLIQIEAAIGAFVLGLYGRHTYWHTVWIPAAIWLVVAMLSYDSLLVIPEFSPGQWQDVLWVGLALGAVLLLSRLTTAARWLWVFATWGLLEAALQLIFLGTLPQLTSLPLALTVVVMLVLAVQKRGFAGYGFVAIALGALILIAPPRTEDALSAEIAQARSLDIPAEATLAHHQQDALPYYMEGFRGPAYRLDGRRSTAIRAFVQRDDLTSVMVKYAPDFSLNEQTDYDAPSLAALQYRQHNSGLWQREQETLSPFDTQRETTITYRPDVRITGYALDQVRITPGSILRVRLDWQLDTPPAEGAGLNVSLLNANGQPITSVFPTIPAETWQALDLTTYHSLRIPPEVEPGVYTLNVGVDYRAGTLGTHRITEVAIPPPTLPVDTPIDTLGDITLYAVDVASANDTLTASMVWGVTEPFDQDYQLFVHLSGTDDLAPLTQSDRPPRYPLRFWRPGEGIEIIRTLDLSTLPAGDYQINVGWFNAAGERLRNETTDFLTIARIHPDGTITTLP